MKRPITEGAQKVLSESEIDHDYTTMKIFVPTGKYNLAQLIEVLNTALANALTGLIVRTRFVGHAPRGEFTATQTTFDLVITSRFNYMVRFEPHLAEMLSLSPAWINKTSRLNMPTFNANFPILYIFSDIVKPNLINGEYQPLLGYVVFSPTITHSLQTQEIMRDVINEEIKTIRVWVNEYPNLKEGIKQTLFSLK